MATALCHLCILSCQFWWHRALKSMLIYEVPCSCIRIILLHMHRICIPFGDGIATVLNACPIQRVRRETFVYHIWSVAPHNVFSLLGKGARCSSLEVFIWVMCTGSIMGSRQLRYQTVFSAVWGSALGWRRCVPTEMPITAHCIMMLNGPAVA